MDHIQTEWELNSHSVLAQDVVGNISLFDLRGMQKAREIHRSQDSRSSIRPDWARGRFLVSADASTVFAPDPPGSLGLSVFSLRGEPLLRRALPSGLGAGSHSVQLGSVAGLGLGQGMGAGFVNSNSHSGSVFWF